MKSQRIVLSILVLLFAAATVHAAPNRASAPEPAFLQSPADRMQEWRDGLLNYIAKRPNLSSEQIEAIQVLGDLDLGSFTSVLEADARGHFAKRLGELGRLLSHEDYLRMLRSLDVKIQGWLIDNKLASPSELEAECNCDSRWDCNGNACQNVTCTHVGGTTHDGRCTGTELEL